MARSIMTSEWMIWLSLKMSQGLINNQLEDNPLWKAPLPEKYFMGRCVKASKLNGREENWLILWRCQLDKLPFRSNTASIFQCKAMAFISNPCLLWERVEGRKCKVPNLPNRMRENCWKVKPLKRVTGVALRSRIPPSARQERERVL